MTHGITSLDRFYRDRKGTVVHVIRYDRINQKVIYRRQGYDFECASPLILFRSRFERIDV